MEQADESAITELMIQPDGRIYVFGASQRMLDLLGELCPRDTCLLERLARMASGTEQPGDSNIATSTSE